MMNSLSHGRIEDQKTPPGHDEVLLFEQRHEPVDHVEESCDQGRQPGEGQPAGRPGEVGTEESLKLSPFRIGGPAARVGP
ncbi:hypothetical protein [Actinomadura oligospora]|uniref:hypothetical protein n=1 Tax=Actinomadura oligospora TaxID=111804 RepID=UPI0012F844B3|nr:hypothetical protein [Actinomadura oligospora]